MHMAAVGAVDMGRIVDRLAGEGAAPRHGQDWRRLPHRSEQRAAFDIGEARAERGDGGVARRLDPCRRLGHPLRGGAEERSPPRRRARWPRRPAAAPRERRASARASAPSHWRSYRRRARPCRGRARRRETRHRRSSPPPASQRRKGRFSALARRSAAPYGICSARRAAGRRGRSPRRPDPPRGRRRKDGARPGRVRRPAAGRAPRARRRRGRNPAAKSSRAGHDDARRELHAEIGPGRHIGEEGFAELLRVDRRAAASAPRRWSSSRSAPLRASPHSASRDRRRRNRSDHRSGRRRAYAPSSGFSSGRVKCMVTIFLSSASSQTSSGGPKAVLAF